jgi:hypothetical protein
MSYLMLLLKKILSIVIKKIKWYLVDNNVINKINKIRGRAGIRLYHK